ncbi:SRPBCC family protein [Undibacterium sp. TS12]|uniref:SRPBCC family protein n=1 Tax=Undibacterium sp. TS12 TaxID=2908202 RepID=UPI001F4D0E51|nr:SRPBCC family protein [Undibacterium sp. TS12]MCH8619195.1 SRPBCC family protein [Undibacterium sp. TS12]
MPIIELSTEIKAAITTVYHVSQDYAVRYEWDPFPDSITMLNDRQGMPVTGTQVLVRSKLGMEMLVEFVQAAPPERAAIVMLKGPWFLKKFAGSWIFEARSAHLTLARFRYTIHTRAFIFTWLLDRLASSYFKHTTAKRLAGLKQYCEKNTRI